MIPLQYRRVRQIIVMVVVLIGGVVASLSLIGSSGGQVSWRQVLLGISGGLAAWICTYSVTNWIDPSFNVHHKTTTDIFDIVSGKFLSLIDERRNAKNSSFYSQFYQTASTVKISGIANQGFVNYLCNKNFREIEKQAHLLTLMGKRAIKVEILLYDPSCDIIQKMDTHEPPGRKNIHFNTIMNQLDLLQKFYNEAKKDGLGLKPGSSLDLRLYCEPLNSTLFYTDNDGSDEVKDNIGSEGILLMGTLYSHKLGVESQLFRIPAFNAKGKIPLYEDCIQHFNTAFSRAHQILLFECGTPPHFDKATYGKLDEIREKMNSAG